MKLPASFKLAGLGTYSSPYYIDTNDLILQAVPQTDVPSSFINEAWILFIVQFNLMLRTLDSNTLHITLPRILRFLSEKNQTIDLGGILVELCTFTNVDYLRTVINTTTNDNTDTDNSSCATTTEGNKNRNNHHDDHNHFQNALFHSTSLLSPSKTTAKIINPTESINNDHDDNNFHRKDSNTSYNSSLTNNIINSNAINDDVIHERLTISKDSTTDSRNYHQDQHHQQHIKNKNNFVSKQSSILKSLYIYIAHSLYTKIMYIYNSIKYYIKICLIKSQIISDDYQLHDPHGYSLSLHEMCIAIRDGKLSLGIIITHPKVMVHNYIIQNDDYYDSDDDDDDDNNDDKIGHENGNNFAEDNDDGDDDKSINDNEYNDNHGQDSDDDDDDDDANKCIEKNKNEINCGDDISNTSTTSTATTNTTTTTTTTTHTTLTSLISIIDHINTGVITPRQSRSSNNNNINSTRNSRSSNQQRRSSQNDIHSDLIISSAKNSYGDNDNNHDDDDNDYILTTYGEKASEISAYYNIMKVADGSTSNDGINRNIVTKLNVTRNSTVRISENRKSNSRYSSNPMNFDNHHHDYQSHDDQHRDVDVSDNFSEFLDFFPSDRYTLTTAHSSLSKDINMSNTIDINVDGDDVSYSTTANDITATNYNNNRTLVKKRISLPIPPSSSPYSPYSSPPITPTRQAQVLSSIHPASSSPSCIKHIHIDHIAFSAFQMPLNIWRYRSSNKECYSHGIKYIQYLLLSSSTNNTIYNTSSTNCSSSGDKSRSIHNNNYNDKSRNRDINVNRYKKRNKHDDNNENEHSSSLHFYNSTYYHHSHSFGVDNDNGGRRIQQRSRQGDSSDDLHSDKAVDGGNSNSNHIHVNILESILNQKSYFNSINDYNNNDNNNIASTATFTNKNNTNENTTTSSTAATSINTFINQKESKVTLDLIIDPSMMTSYQFKQYVINKSLQSNSNCSQCMSIIGYVCWNHYFLFDLKKLLFGKMIKVI